MTTNLQRDKPFTGGPTDDRKRRRSLWKGPAITTALLLVIPLLGNHFVAGWNWHPGAFVVLGALLFGLGVTFQLLTRNTDALAYRAAVGLAFMTGFALLWGSLVQWADVNRAAALYFAVPVVGMIGAAIARLRPMGMALALLATASAQAVVLLIVLTTLVVRNPEVASWSPPEWRGLVGSGVCFLLFLGSAGLFRQAALRETSVGRETEPAAVP